MIAMRLPDDLAAKLELRCSMRKKTQSAVLLEAIERGWEEAVLQPVRQVEPRRNPLDIPGVFLGSQLGNLPAIEDDEPEPAREVCSHPWWEDGARYECLMDKGHKSPKHGLHGKARNIAE